MSKRDREKRAHKQICCKSAHYVVNGENILIPTICIDCQEKGLVLAYNSAQSRMEVICSTREDERGQFIKGCDKVSFAIPMTQREFNIIVDDPNTADYFFYLKMPFQQ